MFVDAPDMLNAFSAIAMRSIHAKNLYEIHAGKDLSGLVFHGDCEGEERITFQADLLARRSLDNPNLIQISTDTQFSPYTLGQKKALLVGIGMQLSMGPYWRIIKTPKGCTSVYHSAPS
ncbi:MAG: hypothetical protein AAF549_04845 [Pseudomonadota bacterium]